MSLKDTISNDMKQFMKDKDVLALEAVRMLRAEIKNAEIDMKKELDDNEVIRVVQSSLKKNKESVEIYAKAGRDDLVAKEQRYIDVLTKYMPEQLSESELTDMIKSTLAELGDIDPKTGFGAAMKAVLAKVGNKADGKLVSAKVKEILG